MTSEGTTKCPDLPLEVIHLCVLQIDEDDDLQQVSYTCHQIREFCLPILFKSVTFTVLYSSTDLFLKKKTKHLKALALHETIPTLIQSFNFAANDLEQTTGEKAHGQVTFSHYFVALIMLVPKLVNIRHLALECPPWIGPAMLNLFPFLPSLPRLVNLKLSIWLFKPLEIEPLLLLREISLKDPIKHDGLNGLLNDPAANPTISIYSLSHIQKISALSFRHSHALFKSVNHQDGDRQLESLTVLRLHVLEPFFQDLLEFLSFCPNVKQLYILQNFNQLSPPPLAIDPAALRALEEFMGPLVLAEVIVPGRPIHTIHVKDLLSELKDDPEFGYDFSLEDLKILGESSAHITTLSIYIEKELASKDGMEFISGLLPHLRTLELIVEVEPDLRDLPPEAAITDKDWPVNRLGLPLVEPLEESDRLGVQVSVRNLLESVDHGYQTLVCGVALGEYPLPNKIERLKIRPAYPDDIDFAEPGEDSSDLLFFYPFTFSMARRIVDALSARYADLASVKIGYHTEKWRFGWEKRGGGDWAVVEMPVDNLRGY